MGKVVSVDADGHLTYVGLLSSCEMAEVDEILEALKDEIPQIEEDLEKEYGKTVLYRYYLGKFLGDLLVRYGIKASERRRFWDEIKLFATKENRRNKEGVNAENRSFYGQCYLLSQLDLETARKLTTKQWESLFNRVGIREDKRLFDWIGSKTEKIRDDDWAEFEKGLHLYLKTKDTSVFSNDELFVIYDSILEMGKYWRIAFKQFSKDFPKSAKIKSKLRRSKKYQSECFRLKKERRCSLDDEIFSEAFDFAMK